MNIWKCWHHTYRVVIYNEKSVLNMTEIYNKLNWGCFQSAAWIKSMVTNCETSWDERVFSVYVIVYIGEYGGGLSCSYTWRPECTLIHGECTLCGNGTPDISALQIAKSHLHRCTNTHRASPPSRLSSLCGIQSKKCDGMASAAGKTHILTLEKWKGRGTGGGEQGAKDERLFGIQRARLI